LSHSLQFNTSIDFLINNDLIKTENISALKNVDLLPDPFYAQIKNQQTLHIIAQKLVENFNPNSASILLSYMELLNNKLLDSEDYSSIIQTSIVNYNISVFLQNLFSFYKKTSSITPPASAIGTLERLGYTVPVRKSGVKRPLAQKLGSTAGGFAIKVYLW